jgi:hypothetical protein
MKREYRESQRSDDDLARTKYRSFLQRAGHCISKKPLNKDYLYESVSQLYLNKPGNA